MAQVSNKEEIKSRARTVVFIFGVLFIVIVARIIYLQNVVNKQLLKDAASNQQKKRTIYATRGNIYASDGLSLLATSVPKYTSIIDPVQAKALIRWLVYWQIFIKIKQSKNTKNEL
jgi:cell division protein FtsI (penicillin-binding protein 3)